MTKLKVGDKVVFLPLEEAKNLTSELGILPRSMEEEVFDNEKHTVKEVFSTGNFEVLDSLFTYDPLWVKSINGIECINKKENTEVFVKNESGGVKADGAKLDWTLIHFKALEGTVKVLKHGEIKYGRENYTKVEKDRYVKALLRHAIDYATGKTIDSDSGLEVLDHLICNCLFLKEKDMENKNGD